MCTHHNKHIYGYTLHTVKGLTKTLRNYISVGTLSPGSMDIFVKGDMIKYKAKQKRSLSTFKTVPEEQSTSETQSRGGT